MVRGVLNENDRGARADRAEIRWIVLGAAALIVMVILGVFLGHPPVKSAAGTMIDFRGHNAPAAAPPNSH